MKPITVNTKLPNVILSLKWSLLAEPNVLHLTVFPFYCYLKTAFDTFKICLEERPFLKLENVSSPKGKREVPCHYRMGSWCPIDFMLVAIVRWITKMCDHFLPTKLAFLDSRETWPGGLVGGRMDNDKKVTSFFFI